MLVPISRPIGPQVYVLRRQPLLVTERGGIGYDGYFTGRRPACGCQHGLGQLPGLGTIGWVAAGAAGLYLVSILFGGKARKRRSELRTASERYRKERARILSEYPRRGGF